MQEYLPFKNPLLSGALVVGLVGFFLTPSPALGQDHDLVMLPPVSASPDPLERGCPNSLSARFRINGVDDYLINSGQVKIRFDWSGGSAPSPPAFPSAAWTLIGELTVTYSASDGPFAIARIWPDDFPSAAGIALSWTPPSTPTSFHVRAEVQYVDPAIVDGNAGDNGTVTRFGSVAGSCPPSRAPLCVGFARSSLVICTIADFIDFRILPCVLNPLRPCPPFDPLPPMCHLVDCPPCLVGLTCPPEQFELLFDNRANDLQIILVSQDGKEVARMETLRRRIRVGRQRFNQRLQFQPEAGVSYHLRVLPGKKTRMDAGHKLQLHLRRGKPQTRKKRLY